MIALGFVGATAIGAASPSAAQGIYFEGPGVGIGIGRPYYSERYYRYDRPYAYHYSRPGWYDRRDYRYRHWDWD